MNLIKSLLSILFLTVFFTACGIGAGGGGSKSAVLNSLEVTGCPNLPFGKDKYEYECIVDPDINEVSISAEASRMFDVTIDGTPTLKKTIQAGVEPVTCVIKVTESISGETSKYNLTVKKRNIGLSTLRLTNLGSSENLIQNFHVDTYNYMDINNKFFSVMLSGTSNCLTCNKEITIKLLSDDGEELDGPWVYDGSFEGVMINLVEPVNYIKIITAVSTYSIKVLKNTDVLTKVQFVEYKGSTQHGTPVIKAPITNNLINFETSSSDITGVEVTLFAAEGAANNAALIYNNSVYKNCVFTKSGDCQFDKEVIAENETKHFSINLYDVDELLLATYDLTIINKATGGGTTNMISDAKLFIQRQGEAPLPVSFVFVPSQEFYYGIVVDSYNTNHDFYYFKFEYDSSIIKGAKTDTYLNGVKLDGGDIAIQEELSDGSGSVVLEIKVRLTHTTNEIRFIFKNNSSQEQTSRQFQLVLDPSEKINIAGFENLVFKNLADETIGSKEDCTVTDSGNNKNIVCAKNSIYCNFKSVKLISKTEDSLSLNNYGYMYISKLIASFSTYPVIVDDDSLTYTRPSSFPSESTITFKNLVNNQFMRDYYVTVKKESPSYMCPTSGL